MAVTMTSPKFYAFDNETGEPLAFGKVYTYQSGTNIPKATYQSEDGVTENTNPVILNSAGYASIYLDGSYKIVVKDADDVDVWTVDPVTDPTGLQKEWANEREATQISPTSFAIVGNHTDVYVVDRALKLDDASFIYGYVVSVQYLSGNTIVEVNAETPLTSQLTRTWTGITGIKSLPRDTITSIAGLKTFTGKVVNVLNYHEGIEGGGGVFYWDDTKDKAEHNGGTVIDPDITFPADWSDTAQQTTWFTAGTGTGCWVRQPTGVYGFKDFGAKGDGITNDTLAIQNSVNSASELHDTGNTYLIDRNISVDGHTGYGIEVSKSIKIVGNNTVFKRFSPDISTYALAYSLLHIGNVEVSNTDIISDVTITGITFEGNDTRHNVGGSTLTDQRTAIELRGINGLKITNCIFNNIDSTAITAKQPRYYSYKQSVTVNMGNKCSNVTINNNEFNTVPHTVQDRSLTKAIALSGVDYATVSYNYFSWCDTCVAGASTYDRYEGSLGYAEEFYTHTAVSYLRSGLSWTVTNNTIHNSSEHAVYFESTESVISNNNITVNSTYCIGDIKVRGTDITISGNTIVCGSLGISVHELSQNVSIIGNVIKANSDNSGSVIDIDTAGIKTWLDNRPHITVDPANYPVSKNINIADNIARFPETGTTYAHGVRLYTDSSSIAGFPNGTLHNVSIVGNTFENVKVGVYFISPLVKKVKIQGNTFAGIPVSGTLTTINDLESKAVFTTRVNQYYTLQETTISNNTMLDFKYVVGIYDGANLTVGSNYHRQPYVFTNNLLSNFGNFSSSLAASQGFLVFTTKDIFKNNRGVNFLARDTSFDSHMVSNSFYTIGESSSGNMGQLIKSGDELRFYKDTLGNFDVLNSIKTISTSDYLKYTVYSGTDYITGNSDLASKGVKIGNVVNYNVSMQTSNLSIGATDPTAILALTIAYTSNQATVTAVNLISNFNTVITGISAKLSGNKIIFLKPDTSALLVSDLSTGTPANILVFNLMFLVD